MIFTDYIDMRWDDIMDYIDMRWDNITDYIDRRWNDIMDYIDINTFHEFLSKESQSC